MTPEEFRQAGHSIIDWIADFQQQVHLQPVMSQLAPGEYRGELANTPPEQGNQLSDITGDLEKLVPALTHFNHPDYFGYFPGNAEPATILGDLVSAAVAQVGINWQASPALTELEELTCDWMRQLFGLSNNFEGVIQDTASATTLVAMLSAREKSSNFSATRGGFQSEQNSYTVYISEHSHSSVEKAALLAGFGRQHIRKIKTDDNYAMRTDLLADAISQDIAAGFIPTIIVGTVGTTTTTALDPIEEIAKIAKANQIWVHVDAALAGSAMILPECRWMWEGIEEVDSLVVNTHKWLGTVFDCAFHFVKDSSHLVRVMSTNPSYLQTNKDGQTRSYRDWSIPLGKKFRALKVWFLLKSEGAETIRARLRRDIENAQWFRQQVEETADWEVLAPVPLQTVCVRHTPQGLIDESLDAHTLNWVNEINSSGDAFLTPAKLDGLWMVRVSIGALKTERENVSDLWNLMQKKAQDSFI